MNDAIFIFFATEDVKVVLVNISKIELWLDRLRSLESEVAKSPAWLTHVGSLISQKISKMEQLFTNLRNRMPQVFLR